MVDVARNYRSMIERINEAAGAGRRGDQSWSIFSCSAF
jgi:hypothetical protein